MLLFEEHEKNTKNIKNGCKKMGSKDSYEIFVHSFAGI